MFNGKTHISTGPFSIAKHQSLPKGISITIPVLSHDHPYRCIYSKPMKHHINHSKTIGNPWKTIGNPCKTIENHGKTIENHSKTIVNPWNTFFKTISQPMWNCWSSRLWGRRKRPESELGTGRATDPHARARSAGVGGGLATGLSFNKGAMLGLPWLNMVFHMDRYDSMG